MICKLCATETLIPAQYEYIRGKFAHGHCLLAFAAAIAQAKNDQAAQLQLIEDSEEVTA